MWITSVFKLLPQLKRTLLISFCLVLGLEALKLAPPYLTKLAIDLLILPNPSLTRVFAYIAGILVISLLSTAVEDRYIFHTARSIFDLETSILRKGHDKLLSLGLRYHEAHPSGDLVQLMNKGSTKLAELMWFIHDQFMGAILQIVLTSIVLVAMHFWCGMVFFLFMPVVIFQVHRTGKKVQPYRQTYHGVFRNASWEMNQSLLNIRTVKDFVQEQDERKKYDNLLDRYLELGKVRIEVENRAARVRDIVLGMARFAVLFYAVYLVYHKDMSTGTLFLFATLSEKVIASLFRLGRLYNYLGDSMESIEQFTHLFQQTADIVDLPDALDCPKLNGSLSFKNVAFEYKTGQVVLHNINLEIPARKVVAFVGRSGAGKSTMIKLISRHYDVTHGAICMDDTDIRKFKVSEYRRQIAVVSQDIDIFDASIRENISYGLGRLTVEQDEIERVSKMANAHEFICQLPQGYDTRVGERGIRLSGGQKQRLGIARALLLKPSLLIFDEATSSLDTHSERLIQDALRRLYHQQTIIIIAHRLSTIESADTIVVFEAGQIVEIGTHAELIQKGGIFANMLSLQKLGELRQ